MQAQYVYEPYPELRAQFLEHEQLLKLSTPWTTVEADVAGDCAAAVAAACRAINGLSRGVGHQDVSDMLSMFREHHLAYLKPRAVALITEQCSRTKASIRKSAQDTADAWVEAYLPAVAHEIEPLPPWRFDIDSCLAHSRINDGDVFDADSAYRFIMHWVFKYMTGPLPVHDRFFELMRTLLKEDEPAFFSMMKFVLRQYHHVTSTSFECLLPAVRTASFAKELVHKLVHEEQGHGRYTIDSLRKLGVDSPASLPLQPEAVGLMDLLRLATSLNPLAFACVFNVFELSGEQDQEPLAALLARSSMPQAGDGIRAHFDFNRAGAHFGSGIHLLDRMGGVDSYTVIEAARIVELHLVFAERLARTSFEYGMKSHAENTARAA